MCGESWHAIKGCTQGWAPGVLPVCMCMCVCVFDGGLSSVFVFGWRVYVWWFGGEINGGGGGALRSFSSFFNS